MEYLLFVAYLVLFAWLVTRVGFFKSSGLSNAQLIILFFIKIIAGIFYGWMGTYYANLAQMQDTWLYHQIGLAEYHILSDDPHAYFVNIFNNPYGGWGNLFASSDSYWNDLKGNVFVKLLSLFDIFSFGHYYVNVIFYSFISLFGPIAIYRIMNDVFPGKKTPVLLAAFFIPSFIYWTSGIHKEGLIFIGVSLILYHLYFGWKEKKYTIKRWLGILSGLLILFILRNFLMLLAVPSILAWMLATRRPKYGLAIFIAVYLFFGLLFFTAKYVDARLDFPQAVVNKQQDFLRLQGGASTIPIKELEPTFASFVKNTPQAITLSFLRPYPGDVRHLLSLVSSIEINLLLLLSLLFILFRKKNGPIAKNPVYLCLFLSFSILLATGFSINNLGAIVRYRSIVIPLLMIPVAAQTDWKKIFIFFSGKNKNNNPPITI
ncbi:MAG TPA: hypothetical protein VI461_13820 [Chitinophagaceae bacterium]|nr:hypothetical protein [Chitinophagaceae bacterium]